MKEPKEPKESAHNEVDKTMSKSKIPRNVNYYRHLLDAAYITENDINWVLRLRDPKRINL